MSQSSGARDPHKHGRSRPPLGSEQQIAIGFGAGGALLLVAVLWLGRAQLLAADSATILLVFGASMAVAAVIAAIVVFYIVMPRISKPGAELAFVAEAIASGDLTRNVRGTTATGVLERIRVAMQGMLVALRAIALDLRTSSRESADRAREISAGCGSSAITAHRISATTNELARQLTASAKSLRQVASDGSRLRQTSAEMATGVHQGNERNARLRVLAQENRSRLEESGTALTALVAGTESSALEIEALAAASEEIRAFVTLVRKMARQSKLLALNAAMEAARAGEHGQGFAVVAGEVRRLARSSADAAEKTDTLVTDVLQRVARARDASGQAVTTVRGVLSATEQGLESFREVERGVIESEAWAAAIDAAAADASTVVSEMSARLEEIASGGESLASAMRDVAASAESQNVGSREIAAAAQALAEAAARVDAIVGTFRLESGAQAGEPRDAARRASNAPRGMVRPETLPAT